MDFIKGKCTRDSCRYFHPPAHLQAQIKAAQQRANAVAAQNAPTQTQLVGLPSAYFTLIQSVCLSVCYLSVSLLLPLSVHLSVLCCLVSVVTLYQYLAYYAC